MIPREVLADPGTFEQWVEQQRPTKKLVNAIASMAILKPETWWWDHQLPLLDGKTPREVWPTDRKKVIQAALSLLESSSS
jgi:hypothetical protein